MAWSNPIAGRHTITAKFGETGPQWSSGRHTGLDFSAPTGTNALAVDDGIVIAVSYHIRYGNLVKVRHSGVDSWYAHLSSVDVRPLQRVTRGRKLGEVGSTGNATGPHLHLEARVAGSAVDPERFLSGGSVPTAVAAGSTGGTGIFDAFGRLTDVVGFVTDTKNWLRVAQFTGGGVLLLLALVMIARKGLTL